MEKINFRALNDTQFSILSHYATVLYTKKIHPDYYSIDYISGLKSAVIFAGIPFEFYNAVEAGDIAGLKNTNRIELIEFFE